MTEAAMTKNDTHELVNLVTQVREINEKVEKGALDLEKLEKMNARIDEFEEINQQLTIKEQRDQKYQQEIELKLSKIESHMALSHDKNKPSEDSEHYKNFKEYIREGQSSESRISQSRELKAVSRTDFGPNAGYLVPVEFSSRVIETILEVSPVRQISGQMNMGSTALKVPRLDGYPVATWVGETQSSTETSPTFAQLELTNDALTAQVKITEEMLMNSAFNLEDFMRRVVTRSLLFAENKAFLDGDGVNKPIGILTSTEPNQFTTGTVGELTYNDIIDLETTLKEGYVNTVYMFNKVTLGILRKLTDLSGQYLWQPRVDLGTPATINGRPYVIAQDMPDVATGNKAIIFGDFENGYTITDRRGMSLLVNPYSQATSRIIQYNFAEYVGGQVTLGEALTVGTIA